VEVPAFAIDKYKVSNGQHLEFMEAGGYANRAFWTEAAWQWRVAQNVAHPAFWRHGADGWLYRGMFEEVALPLDGPVYVSHAEASAYARWAGKQLPTEPQWQRAALEAHATKVYYFITPPDPKSSPAKQAELLAYWNRPMLQNLTVHESLPGHFTQYLFQHANPGWSLVRKLVGSYTTTEGWAHYSEQMMLEQGLSAGDPRYRLTQLQDALLRDCRIGGKLFDNGWAVRHRWC